MRGSVRGEPGDRLSYRDDNVGTYTMRQVLMTYRQVVFGAVVVVAMLFWTFPYTAHCTCPPECPPIAFVNVHVIPMDQERILDHHTVIIREGRIVQLGKIAEVTIPPDTRIIDGEGRYLLPGLCDMHTHIPYKNDLSLYLAYGITTVRNMFGFPYHVDLKHKIHRGELLGPRLYTVGPIIDGDPPCWPGSVSVRTPEEAVRMIAAQKEAGYDGGKVYNGVPKAAYERLAAFARQEHFPLSGHVPLAVGIQGVIAAQQRSIEHLDGYWWGVIADTVPIGPWIGLSTTELFSERPRTLERLLVEGRITEAQLVDPHKLRDLVTATVEADVWNVPTLVVTDRFRALRAVPNDQAQVDHPVLSALVAPYLAVLQRHEEQLQEMSAAERHSLGVWYRQRATITSALYEAGARLLVGTDAGAPFILPGVSFHAELRNLVEVGLSPYEAIRAGTQQAAEFLNAQDEFGTITVNTQADLILVDGNPLEDISNLANIAGVMVRGYWLTHADLDQRLYELGGNIYGR